MQDKSIHHIQEEHRGIIYSYISNIQQDNIFAIIKYTMPLSIEELFKNRNKISHTINNRDTLYIALTYEELQNKYYLTMDICQSEDLDLSHTEVLRITGSSIDNVLRAYQKFYTTSTFYNRILSAIRGDAYTSRNYINADEEEKQRS
jgi:hypothetical protein